MGAAEPQDRPPARPSLAGASMVVDVGAVAHGGHCVARHEGRVLFVRHTLPGERVRVVVTKGAEGDRFLLADAVEVLQPSASRVPPRCPWSGPGRCGGCDWQHVDLEEQRRLKAAVVREQLLRLAGLDVPVTVEALPGDKDGLRWRTRVEFAVGPQGEPGLRRHHSHDVIAIDDCPIATESVAHSGVLSSLWPAHRAVDVVGPSGGSTEVVTVPIPLTGRPSDVPDITERVDAGAWSGDFTLSARGFWQVHPGAASTYVRHVLASLDPVPAEHALDLYAGVGLFARALADAVGVSGSVLAVESDPRAASDAERNLAGYRQARVRRGRVDRVLAPLVRQRRRARAVDLVVLDPPRTGAGRSVVRDIVALRPRVVAYVACDPAALARDLAYARDAGYLLDSLRAFDAFPMTQHIECIAILRPATR